MRRSLQHAASGLLDDILGIGRISNKPAHQGLPPLMVLAQKFAENGAQVLIAHLFE
jgi:hypothetical protein